MKRLLFLIVITAMGMFKGHSQALVQTYTDRCTGQVSVFAVPIDGQTVVAFYNRSRTFTAQDFQNGTLQSWLEETYLWWSSISPCSSTTTGAQATQQTTQQTTQQATQAATNAAQQAATTTSAPTTSIPVPTTPTTNAPSTPTSPPPPPETSQAPITDTSTANPTASTESQPTGGTDNANTGNGSTASTGSEAGDTTTQQDSTTNETPSSETSASTEETTSSNSSESTDSTETQNETESTSDSASEGNQEETGNDTGDSDDGQSNQEETESENVEESSEETSSEESSEETSNEETDESTDEETTEESSEEDSTEEESDQSTEEDSEEETDKEESESEESEESEEEDSNEESDNETKEKDEKKKKKKRALSPPIVMANMLNQQGPDGTYTQSAMFGISQSSLLGTETYGLNAMVYSNLQQFMLTANYSKVHINKEGRVNRVYSGSVGMMKMFTTYMVMMNHSMVWMGKKGTVAGLALGTNITSVELDVRKGLIYYDNQILGTSLTGFVTKPLNFSRLTISPMLAISSPFYNFDLYKHTHTFNPDIMIIGGANFTYKLTQRFGINIGINLIEATTPEFPTLKTFTIGGRLSF